MEYQHILFTRSEGVGHISLNSPGTLNALTRDMLREFDAALDVCSAPDSGVRCLLLTGEGRGFSSGMNLADPGGSKSARLDTGHILDQIISPLVQKWRDLEIPVVVGLHGATAGVTMSIALMGDIILAARSAYFLQPFSNIGLIPDGGATWLLPRMLGKARAFEVSLLGERLPAEKALEWGLINAVHDDDKLRDEAVAMARRLAQGPTRAFALTRKAFWDGFENTFNQQLYLESIFQRAAGSTDDAQTARQAFLEKKRPVFTGR
ncbi:MAG: enoyl-CoA hydratase-related protein [Alphaproteobacteria bacterium]